MTFEEILQRALDRVPDSFDKREGSVIYDAIAPAAYELALAYEEMHKLHADTYARTATRQGLIDRAAEYGLTPFPATCAVRKGVFTPATLEVEIGARFNHEELNFAVTEKLADGEYLLQCETIGVAGNSGVGLLIPVDYIAGLETATLTDVVIYGEEEEETEALRTRYFEAINSDARDGNVAQYQQWANEYPGIGNYKVFSLWNGKNTVKVSILNSENGVASEQLISDFQEYLDPNSTGLGNGVAPIGAVVTVSTATEVPLDLTGNVTLAAGYENTADVEGMVKAYLADIAYKKTIVSYMSLGAVVQDCPCVDDLSDFKINGDMGNVVLGAEQIAVLNSLTLVVV